MNTNALEGSPPILQGPTDLIEYIGSSEHMYNHDIVEYKDLNSIFQTDIKSKEIKNLTSKTSVNIKPLVFFTPDAELSDKLFQGFMVKSGEFSNCFIKVCYKGGNFKMLGKQKRVNFKEYSSRISFSNYIHEQLNIVYSKYGAAYDYNKISYLTLTFVPIRYNIISNYKVDSEDMLGTNLFIQFNFPKVFLPVSTNYVNFGGIVKSTITDGKFSNLQFMDTFTNKVESLCDKNLIVDNIATLPLTFKFYNITINNKDYIIGVDFLSSDSVRKVRLSKTGIILEDIIDHNLADGNIKRVCGNNVIIIKNNKVIRGYKDLHLIPINNKKRGRKYTALGVMENPNIGVIDFETYRSGDNTYKVCACGFKTNLSNLSKTYYIEDLDKPEEPVLNLVDELLRSKYNRNTFYMHNLGGYDVIFLLKILVDYNQANPSEGYKLEFMYRDSTILSIIISKGKNKLTIKDSYALFPSSLRNLAEVYKCDHLKGHFPYSFSNNETLFYKGPTPHISYYESVSLEDYNTFVSNNWDHKLECLKYLVNDLDTLFEVLSKANKSLFLKYDLDFTKVYTVSGLALNLFLSKYYKDNIPSINTKSVYSDIKKSYYGGITEVYKPLGRDLYYYDINSLYPYAALSDMPGLTCRHYNFIDNNSIDYEDLFGFFHCKVDATNVKAEYLGLLPVRLNGLIFPHGKWSGWYFSEEFKFASNYGYKIDVTEGYSFSRVSDVFKDYVKDVHLHKNNAKNPTEKFLAKSLLNNLLGRFGIDLEKSETKLMDDSEFEEMLLVRDLKSHISIGNMNLVTYSTALNYDLIEENGLDIIKVLENHSNREVLNQTASSVAISSAVTAYARIIMHKHKITAICEGLELYYSDTDSLVLSGPLPSELVHPTKLGMFKLEHKVQEGIFITGKTYCLVLEDGTLIKRAKGVTPESLTYNDYLDLNTNKSVPANKKTSIKDYSKGSVTIQDVGIFLKGDAYNRRVKLYDDSSVWINTKPIYISLTETMELTKYKHIVVDLVVLLPDVIILPNPYANDHLIIYKKPVLDLLVIKSISVKHLILPDFTWSSNEVKNSSPLVLYFNQYKWYPLLGLCLIFYLLDKLHNIENEILDPQEDDSLIVVVNNTELNTLSIPDLNTKHYVNNISFIEKLFRNRNSEVENTSPILTSLPYTLDSQSIVDTSVNTSLTLSTNSSSITTSTNSTPITSYSDNLPIKTYVSVGPSGIIFTDTQQSLDYNEDRNYYTELVNETKDMESRLSNDNLNMLIFKNARNIENVSNLGDSYLKESILDNLNKECQFLTDLRCKRNEVGDIENLLYKTLIAERNEYARSITTQLGETTKLSHHPYVGIVDVSDLERLINCLM